MRPRQSSHTRPSRRKVAAGQSGRKLWSVWTTLTPEPWAARSAAGLRSGKVL